MPNRVYLILIVPLFFRIGIIFSDRVESSETNTGSPQAQKTAQSKEISDLEYQLAFAYEDKSDENKINERYIINDPHTTTLYPKEEEEKQENQLFKLEEPPIKYDIPNVLFYSQAPFGNRNEPYQNACEEASVLLAYYYATRQTPTKKQYNKDLLNLLAREQNNIGHHKKTTLDQFLYLTHEYLKFPNAYILENADLDEIKREISKWNIIVASFRWDEIYNFHYSANGPDYHVILLKGYDENNFITHDVGTVRWDNRKYPFEMIMDALAYGNKNDLKHPGNKVIIFQK